MGTWKLEARTKLWWPTGLARELIGKIVGFIALPVSPDTERGGDSEFSPNLPCCVHFVDLGELFSLRLGRKVSWLFDFFWLF